MVFNPNKILGDHKHCKMRTKSLPEPTIDARRKAVPLVLFVHDKHRLI
jgi:hypothetical protein